VNKLSSIRAPRSPGVSEYDNEAKRATMVGSTVRVLEGKARDYAMKEFFAEQVPAVRGEKVIKQTGLPDGLELVK
jgi:hypothetical protein